MGRNKQYDRMTIVRQAMQVFWQHGYEATSTQMLVDAMGVNRFTLYAEFENKQAIYMAALALYYEEMVGRNLAVLEAPQAGIEAAQQLLSNMVNWANEPSSELGCFICNAATERAPMDLESRDFVQRYTNRLTQGFANCLRQAQIDNHVQTDIDPIQEGQILATIFLGLLVQLRAQAPLAQIQGIGKGAQAYFDRLRKG